MCTRIGRNRVERILIYPFTQMVLNGDKTGIAGDLSIDMRDFIKKTIALVNILLD